jgi:hypothetical protein
LESELVESLMSEWRAGGLACVFQAKDIDELIADEEAEFDPVAAFIHRHPQPVAPSTS